MLHLAEDIRERKRLRHRLLELHRCGLDGLASKALVRELDVLGVELDTEIAALMLERDEPRRPGAVEWIEHDIVRPRASEDAGLDELWRERGEMGALERARSDGPDGATIAAERVRAASIF